MSSNATSRQPSRRSARRHVSGTRTEPAVTSTINLRRIWIAVPALRASRISSIPSHQVLVDRCYFRIFLQLCRRLRQNETALSQQQHNRGLDTGHSFPRGRPHRGVSFRRRRLLCWGGQQPFGSGYGYTVSSETTRSESLSSRRRIPGPQSFPSQTGRNQPRYYPHYGDFVSLLKGLAYWAFSF